MKGGVLGLGRIATGLVGKDLTVHQKAKDLAYGSLMRASPLKSFTSGLEFMFGDSCDSYPCDSCDS